MNIWKNTKVLTTFGTTANFNRMRFGSPIFFDGTDYFTIDLEKPAQSPEAVKHLPGFNEDWDNEELIRDFVDDVLHMLQYYKKPEARAEMSEDGKPVDYDELVKTIFFDRCQEAIETMAGRAVIFDDLIENDESKPVTTTHEMARRLTQWPHNTTVFIDTDYSKDDYEWHFPIVYTPSLSELKAYRETGQDTFTSIKLDDDVQGC